MKKAVFIDTVHKNKNAFVILAAAAVVDLCVFLLYRINIEPLIYSGIIILVLCVVLFAVDYAKGIKKAEQLQLAEQALPEELSLLPEPDSLSERSYRRMLDSLSKEAEKLSFAFAEERRDMQDWYTVWVHRIKTPIAVMKLNLTEKDADILNELFRIEEYVDMALSYIRLGSETTDLVIGEYRVDDMIREAVKKYAPQFIAKKIKLSYEPADITVITDRKWFLCILEQLISNAVKYTDSGTVTIKAENNRIEIEDTGAGISPEDLPRIFEKGYTGLNGRTNVKSSGLGLYLCKKASELINVSIKAESEAGKRSCFTVEFPEKNGF